MNNKSKDFTQQAQDFVTRSIAEQIRTAQRAYDLMVRFGRGELSTRAVYDEYIRFASQETSRYMSELAMLSFNYYNDWLAMNQRYNSLFFSTFGGKSTSMGAEVVAREAVESRRIEIALHAPVGQVAVQSFVLENKHGETADISFLVSDFAGPSGTTAIRLPIQIQPDRFDLAPGQEVTVTLRLPLRAGLLNFGQQYHGTINIQGYDNLELGLTIWADAPINDKKESSSTDAPEKTPVKKRSNRKSTNRKKLNDG